MLIIDRYILKKGLPSFLYCLAAFLLLIIVIDLFESLDMILRNKINFPIIIQYYLCLLPSFILKSSPLAVLLGCIFTFNNLERFNEITALKAIGVHLYRVILPVLFFGLIISCTNILLNEFIIPQSSFLGTILKKKHFHTNKEQSYIKKNVTLKTNRNAYFIQEYYVEHKEMFHVIILQYDTNDKITRRINAEKATWTSVGWIFYNGTIYNYNQRNINKSVVDNFAEKFLQIPEKPEIFEKNFDIEIMSIRELRSYINTLKANGYETSKQEVLLHSRIAYPFASLVLLFVGIPFILSGQSSIMHGVISSLVVAFIYQGTFFIGLSMGNGGYLPPLLAAWLINLLFIGIGLVMMPSIKT